MWCTCLRTCSNGSALNHPDRAVRLQLSELLFFQIFYEVLMQVRGSPRLLASAGPIW